MSKVMCFGSINVDQIIPVHRIVKPGETALSLGPSKPPTLGGKGANQAIAIHRVGGLFL